MNEKYTITYQLTHDIDWFCMIGNVPMHFASNGGILPDKVNNYKQNRKIQFAVAKQEFKLNEKEVILNSDYIKERLVINDSVSNIENYVESFIDMARKGFTSFDRYINYKDHNLFNRLYDRVGSSDDSYIWVAKPQKLIDFSIDGLPYFEKDVCPFYESKKEILHVRCLNNRYNR